MIKIVCTGNPNIEGIPKSLKLLYPNTVFVSKSSGYNLLTEEGINKFKELLPKCNVFVNCSSISEGTQELLFNIVAHEWTEGSIFNIGSIVEAHTISHLNPETAKEKLSLRRLSINACTGKLKTTHMIVGGFRSGLNTDSSRMDPMCIANAIDWILKNNINIPLISLLLL
jgi:hypothetical protein